METIEQIDRSLFFFFNGLHNNLFDDVMPWISSTTFWIPFYFFLAYLLYKSIGKKIMSAFICIILLISLSDQTCGIIKKQVQRYRPSHNVEIQNQVHIVDGYRGGQFGFVSSHAANAFAIAFFLIFLFEDKQNWFKAALIAWAILVSYSRIYLGVHYPSDVTGGAVIGIVYSLLIYKLYGKLSVFLQPDPPN